MPKTLRILNARWAEILAVFLLPLALFSVAILPATRFNDIDGFFHYRVAELIGRGHLWADIPWLPYTVLGPQGPDQHWLFHVLIAPFTWIHDPLLGMKIAIVVTASLIAPALYFLLRAWQVPYAWLFAMLAVFGGLIVPWRFEMLRAQGLSVVCAVAFVFLLVRRRLLATLVLIWFFFNAYQGAAIILPAFCCYMAWQGLQTRAIDFRVLIVFLAGIALAFVVNPWYPKNVEYILFHILFKMRDHFGDNVGAEWLPTPWSDFVVDNALLHLIWLSLLARTAWDLARRRQALLQIPAETVIMAALAGLMFVSTLRMNRFIEYYGPFCAVSSGLLLRDVLARERAGTASISSPLSSARLVRSGVALAAAGLLFCALGNLAGTRSRQIFDIAAYRPLADYLSRHVAKGTLIFNSAWSDFPQLLWYTRDYPMANGLDVHYLAYGDPQRFALWFKLTQLYQFDSPKLIDDVETSFHTRWILVHTADRPLAEYLVDSHRAILRFKYENGWLFEIQP